MKSNWLPMEEAPFDMYILLKEADGDINICDFTSNGWAIKNSKDEISGDPYYAENPIGWMHLPE